MGFHRTTQIWFSKFGSLVPLVLLFTWGCLLLALLVLLLTQGWLLLFSSCYYFFPLTAITLPLLFFFSCCCYFSHMVLLFSFDEIIYLSIIQLFKLILTNEKFNNQIVKIECENQLLFYI